MNFNYLRYVSMAFLLIFMGSSFTYAQTVYTFTAATATGENGPTQAMVNTEYAGTNLAGKVDVTGGIQYWEIPATGKYVIEAFGGQGYGPFGGRGAHMTGEFILTGGDTLKILVGQKGGDYLNFPATTYNQQFGGGGGSFVTKTDNTPYVVAGGGGWKPHNKLCDDLRRANYYVWCSWSSYPFRCRRNCWYGRYASDQC